MATKKKKKLYPAWGDELTHANPVGRNIGWEMYIKPMSVDQLSWVVGKNDREVG